MFDSLRVLRRRSLGNKWNSAAQAASDSEWDKLSNFPWPDKKGKGVWDLRTVRESSDVRNEAHRKGETEHFGRLAEMVFLKNAELAEGHPDQKHKGRDVFLGDQVKDQDFNFAIFDDLGSAPPTMEAARALDAVSLFPGYEQQQSDATSAYAQAFLRGQETWIALPRERWPKS